VRTTLIPSASCSLVSGTFLCMLAAAACHAQADQGRLEQTRQRVREVQPQILGRGCFLPQTQFGCMQTEIDALRAAMRDYTLWKLNQPGEDTKQLAEDLRAINDAYARETVLKGSDGTAYAFEQKTTAGDFSITVTYFSSGAIAFPARIVIIQGFRKEGGRWVFAAETGESVSGIMYYRPLQLLQSPVSSEMWLLIGGQVAGFMGDLERARVYAFNGYEFRELWKPEDREDMEITVKSNEIHATYLGPRIKRFPGYYQNHMEETLQLTPSGVLQTNLINHGEDPPAPAGNSR
jgi:hypothetical protein